MATAPLVEHDLERGAALVNALRRSQIPVDFVAWSYSEDDEQWRLMIATTLVDSNGRLATYGRVRQVIAEDPWLNPGVGRLALVSPEDPDVRRFRELAQAPITEDLAVHGETGVIRGRSVDASYVYNSAALQFEEELFTALQRLVPSSAVLRRAGKVFENPHQVDFLLDSGSGPVFIEAKATDRAVTARELLSIRSGLPVEAPLIVISRGGFTEDGSAEQLGHLFRVIWRTRDDDPQLATALQSALA